MYKEAFYVSFIYQKDTECTKKKELNYFFQNFDALFPIRSECTSMFFCFIAAFIKVL